MDISHLSEKELNDLENDIIKQKASLRQAQKIARQQAIEKRLNFLRDHRDLILPLLQHDRSSCSDDKVVNGYGSASYGARCVKCHLIEILDGDWGNRFDVKINVEIFDTVE